MQETVDLLNGSLLVVRIGFWIMAVGFSIMLTAGVVGSVVFSNLKPEETIMWRGF